jgi:hypothetical protein
VSPGRAMLEGCGQAVRALALMLRMPPGSARIMQARVAHLLGWPAAQRRLAPRPARTPLRRAARKGTAVIGYRRSPAGLARFTPLVPAPVSPRSLMVATSQRDTGAALSAPGESIPIGMVYSTCPDAQGSASPGGAGALRSDSPLLFLEIGGSRRATSKARAGRGTASPAREPRTVSRDPFERGGCPATPRATFLHLSRRGRAMRPWP